MPNPLDITNIPAPRVEFIDPRTGLMAREWYRFFFNLFNLTGNGSNDTSLSDLQIGPPPINNVLGEINASFDQSQLAAMSDQAEVVLGQLGLVYDQAQLASMIAQYEQATLNLQNQFDTAPAAPQLGTIAAYNLDGSPTAGGVGYGTGSAVAFTPAGTTGQFLTSAAAGTPTWSSPSSIAVTSFSAGTTGLTPAAATTGAVTLAGTLAVANGGTGTSTAFTPGSVVFAGASGVYSQDNTNLFWDNTNKLLGIGTSTPQVALDVLGVGSFSALVYSPLLIGGTSPTSSLQLRSTLGAGTTGADIVFQVGSNGGTEAMRITNAGNVGIRGTPIAGAMLSLGTTGSVSSTSPAKLSLGGTYSTSAGLYPKLSLYDDGVSQYGFGISVSQMEFQIPTGGRYVWYINAAEQARIGSAGNFLLGTTAAVMSGVERMTVAGATVTDVSGAYPVTAIFSDTRAYNSTAPAAGGGIGFGYKYNSAGAVTVGPSIQGYKENTTDGDYGAGLRFLTRVNGGQPAERIRITSSGHVGISTAPSAWVSSVRAIQIGVGGSVSTWDGSNGSVTLGANLYDSGGSIIRYINSAAAGAFDVIAGAFTWRTAPSGIAGDPITFTQAMTLTSAGSLGIGTASPAQVLDVVGGIRSTSGANNITLRHDGTNGSIINNGGSFLLYAQGVQAMLFHTNNVERMRITSTGSVGIGTGTPSANLEVNRGSEGEYLRVGGDNALNGRSLRFTSSTNDGSNGALHTINAASASGVIAFATGGTERMRVTNTGTVGIGTTTNLSTLTVNGSFASKSPSTVNAATYTVAATDGSLRFTTTNCTVTLPAAASFPGRILYLNTITANSVTSAAANVIPLGSNTAGTAILAATAGKFAMIQSDGTNWITMMSN